MNRFSEIFEVLLYHKNEIDKIIRNYRKKDQKNREIYSDAMCDKLHEENLIDAKSSFDIRQHTTAVRINQIFDDLQNELKAWVNTPISRDQLSLISTLLSLDVKLSAGELQALESSLGNNYFAHKLAQKLAEASGLKGFKAKYNLDHYTTMLKSVRNDAEIFIIAYCGDIKNYTPELLNVKDFINAKQLSYAAADAKCLKADSSIMAASLIWSGDCIPCSHKISLTSSEKENLEQMFAGCSTDAAKASRAKQLVQQMPLMRDVLESQPQYREFLPAEEADAD